jgi:hypothetical protein
MGSGPACLIKIHRLRGPTLCRFHTAVTTPPPLGKDNYSSAHILSCNQHIPLACYSWNILVFIPCRISLLVRSTCPFVCGCVADDG